MVWSVSGPSSVRLAIEGELQDPSVTSRNVDSETWRRGESAPFRPRAAATVAVVGKIEGRFFLPTTQGPLSQGAFLTQAAPTCGKAAETLIIFGRQP